MGHDPLEIILSNYLSAWTELYIQWASTDCELID